MKTGIITRIVGTFAAGVLAVSLLTGCSGNTPTDSSSKNTEAVTGVPEETKLAEGNSEDTLTIALALEPNTLMPAPNSAKEGGMVIDCMCETLFKWDPKTGEVLPNLGSFEWIDDSHFRVTLKEGIYFQNGDELTADDVLYTFEVNNKLSPGRLSTINLDAATIEDDYNLIFEVNGTWVQAPEKWVQDDMVIMSKKTLEAMGGADNTALYPKEGYGTGKYIFKEWVSGQYILLERNDNYWNKEDLPYYKYMKFIFVNDSAARAMAVESGDANVGSDLPTTQAAIYEGNTNIDVHYLDTEMTGVLFMNTQNKYLANEKVREAIYNLVDVNALNQLAANGKGVSCQTTISPYSIVYDADHTERVVDVEKAKALLAESGFGDGITLELTVMATQQSAAEIVQENLRQAGITVNVTINETPTHFQWLHDGTYDMHIADLSAVYYTENLRLVDGRIPTSVVYGGAAYENEEFYELLDTAYNAFDMDERIKAYKACQDYMKEHYLVVGMNTTMKLELTTAGLSAPGLTGYGWADYTQVRPVE